MAMIETTGSEIVYENKWLRVRVDQILRGDKEGIYGIVERSDSVVIIPVSPSNNTVLLRQYRYPTRTYSWELPMGGIDAEEPAVAAARRELLEETQLEQLILEQIGEYYAVPGLTPQKVSVFVAPVSDEELLQAYAPQGTDDIQDTMIVPLESLYRMVSDGQITDGFTLVGLLYLRLFQEKSNVSGN